jgi:hypothetical protein
VKEWLQARKELCQSLLVSWNSLSLRDKFDSDIDDLREHVPVKAVVTIVDSALSISPVAICPW